jgi:hypothetical protein
LEQQVYGLTAATEDGHGWFVGHRPILDKALRKHVPLPDGISLLKAPCGTGGTLATPEDFEPVPAFVTYFNTLLFPVIAAVRFVKNLLGRESADDAIVPPRLLNGMLSALFASERHLVGRITLPVGVPVLMLARRPGP